MRGASILDVIDRLIETPKTIVGAPHWTPVNLRGEQRLLMTLAVGDVPIEATLEVDAYPNVREMRFRVMLNAPKCVSRIDYVSDESHANPLGVYDQHTPVGIFFAPHFHSWADNRQFGTHASTPDSLPIARVLPPDSPRSFDSILRWFCSEIGVASPASSMINLPGRTRLI